MGSCYQTVCFMRPPKICLLDTSWASNNYRKETGHYGAIAYYRLIKPLEYLKEWAEIDYFGKELRQFKTGEEAYLALARKYDIIFSKHVDNGAAGSNILACAEHYGRKVVVDLDDNYLQIRDDNPAAPVYAPLKGGRYFLGAFITLANGLTVSTEPLKDVYAKMDYANPSIDVLPNCNDVNDWKFDRVNKKDGKIRIGYMGSITHNDDLALIWEPIAKILAKYPNVMFEICGAVGPDDIKDTMAKIQSYVEKDILNQFWFYEGTQSFFGFPELMFKLGWDIGIAPLVDEPFNRGKSHIKWFDYTMVSIPTIASKTYPYCTPIQGVDTIVNGKTGLLVENKVDDWYNAIESVIVNATYRQELAENAYTFIRDNWQFSQHAHKWKAVFEKYL